LKYENFSHLSIEYHANTHVGKSSYENNMKLDVNALC